MQLPRWNRAVFSLIGMVLGFAIFHPYTMVIYALMHSHESALHFHWNDLIAPAFLAFEPNMLPMAISFVVFGGAIGLLVGIAIDKTKKLVWAEAEREKSKIALETLEQLMVTLSHYLLNANMVIGNKARRCQKKASQNDVLSDLSIIEEQAHKIDAVMKSLREVTEVKTTLYSTGGTTRMIDIAREIEMQIKDIDQENEGPAR
jgi:hypothetical protein